MKPGFKLCNIVIKYNYYSFIFDILIKNTNDEMLTFYEQKNAFVWL